MASNSTRISVVYLRIAQIICNIATIGVGIGIALSFNALGINVAWAGAWHITVASISISFFRQEPLQLWPLPVVLDSLAILSCLGGIVSMALTTSFSYYEYYSAWPIAVVALVLMAVSGFSFAITITLDCRLHQKRRKVTEPSDPLTPYLMKKEIDVWCYPVQNENGQLGMQYVPATKGTEPPGLPPKDAPNQDVEGSQQPQQSIREYQIDRIEIVQNTQQSIASQPLTDTVAGWSVPSGNATLRLSQVTPFTYAPSYRSRDFTIKSGNQENV